MITLILGGKKLNIQGATSVERYKSVYGNITHYVLNNQLYRYRSEGDDLIVLDEEIESFKITNGDLYSLTVDGRLFINPKLIINHQLQLKISSKVKTIEYINHNNAHYQCRCISDHPINDTLIILVR